jgi:hypothetical protein
MESGLATAMARLSALVTGRPFGVGVGCRKVQTTITFTTAGFTAKANNV